jgi:hypothetical protein
MVLSLSIVLYSITQKKVQNLPGLFLITITAWVSLWHYRHLPIYAIAWCCYTPSYIEDTKFGKLIKTTWRNNCKILSILFVIIGMLGIIYAVKNQFWELRVPTLNIERDKGAPIYPTGAVKYFKNMKFSGNIMVPFNAGSYVSWNLYPDVKVSMDSRFEVAYPMEVFLENINFYEASDDWQNTLNRYRTDAVLVPRRSKIEDVLKKNDLQLNDKLTHSWVQRYIDDAYSVYFRSDIALNYHAMDMRGKPIIGTFP